MNGKPWEPQHQAILDEWGGKKPDAEIGRMTGGHAEITVRKRREAAGIAAYCPRPTWTRRDWLLASAAGLDFQISG